MLVYCSMNLDDLVRLFESSLRCLPPRKDRAVSIGSRDRRVEESAHSFARKREHAGYVAEFRIADSKDAEDELTNKPASRDLTLPEHETLNERITGQACITSAFFSPDYRGYVPELGSLCGQSASEQWMTLARVRVQSDGDFEGEIVGNVTAVFVNFFFWEITNFAHLGLAKAERDWLLQDVRRAFAVAHEGIQLGVTSGAEFVIRA